MTWWEVEQIEAYLTGLEEALEKWSLSNPEMRIEQKHVARVVEKLNSILPQISQISKKTLILQLSERAEVLQKYLKERLKREEPNRYSPRNLLL